MKTQSPAGFGIVVLGLASIQLSGCGRDTQSLSQSLVQTRSWTKTQADCYASRLAEMLDGKSYDRVVALMERGADFKEALNMARRSTGKSYSSAVNNDAELAACMDDEHASGKP